MSDKENDLIREDTVTEPEADAAAAADNAEGAERDAAPSEPETAKRSRSRSSPSFLWECCSRSSSSPHTSAL